MPFNHLARTAVGFILFLLLTTSPSSAPNVSGYLTTQDGKTLSFESIGQASRTVYFLYGLEMNKSNIPLTDLKRIVMGEYPTAIFYFKDGRELAVTFKSFDHGDGRLGTKYLDVVTGQLRNRYVPMNELKELSLGNEIGRFRSCPLDGSFWPDTYLFCPHDGTKTVWASP